jgi:hypothetical protein
MLIQRLIVEDMTGTCVCNSSIAPQTTEAEIRKAFKDQKLPIFSPSVDTVGVALVKVNKRLPGKHS